MWTSLFFCVGLIHVAYFIYGVLSYLRRHCLLKKLDLNKRYGIGTWALVTGGSDGIGAEYCLQLAREGFNICIVSRTRSKLEAIEKKIRAENEKVETMTIEFDFEGVTTMAEYEELRRMITDKGIDVSMLVLNAGVLNQGKLENITGKQCQAVLDVNMYQPTAMLKKFLPMLLEREEQSSVVFVSSVVGKSPVPAGMAYSSSKAYLNYLALAVSQELTAHNKHQLDVQILCPYFVQSNMTTDVLIPLRSLFVASPTSVVKSSLNQLGHPKLPGELAITSGTAFHDLNNQLMWWLGANTPMFVTKYVSYFFYDH